MYLNINIAYWYNFPTFKCNRFISQTFKNKIQKNHCHELLYKLS